MTVAANTWRAGPYTGNGVATSFAFNFKAPAETDLRVVLTVVGTEVESDLVLDSDYSVTLNPDQDTDPGGTIIYPLSGSPMANTHKLTIVSNVEISQLTDITNAGGFYPEVIEDAIDKLTVISAQLAEQVGRTVKVPVSSATDPDDLVGQINGYVASAADSATAAAASAADAAESASTVAAYFTNLASQIGASLVGFIQAGVGAIARTVQDKLRESISVKDYGGAGDGATDDLSKFQSFDAQTNGIKTIPEGSYFLSSNWEPPTQDVTIAAAGGVSFSNAKANFKNLIPYQSGPGPLWSQHLVSKSYGAQWTGYGNIFQIASSARSGAASIPVVAVFGQGSADAASSKVWGGNFVAYANNATATAIAQELNCGVMQAGGSAYGLLVASSATAGQPKAAIQIQSNEVESQFLTGINFNYREVEGLVTGNLINASGTGANTSAKLLNSSGVTYTSAEIDIPSFLVDATQANTVNRVSIRGAATGVAPRIFATGSDTNVSLELRARGAGQVIFKANSGTENFRILGVDGVDNLQVSAGTGSADLGIRGTSANPDVTVTGKGTGSVKLRDGAGATKVQVNTTGIGFNGAAPVAKPSITGSRGGNAALASLLAQLAAMGLITDNTTA